MEEKFALFWNDIEKATQNSEDIIFNLTNLKGATIFIGSGGSRVVAEFAAKVIARINNIIGVVLDPSDLSTYDISCFKNIFIVSCGGKNFGVKNSFVEGKQIFLLSARKTCIKDEVLLSYQMDLRDSFISLNQTIVPMAVLLKYYLQDKYKKIIAEIFRSVDKDLKIDLRDLTNIYTNFGTKTAATFLESTLCESGLSVPLVHQKYDYCHGRSTINKNRKNSSVLLINGETDLDKSLEEVLRQSFADVLKLEGIFRDEIVNDFYLTLQCMYLIKNISAARRVDLTKIDYDRSVVKKLYYFKGSM